MSKKYTLNKTDIERWTRNIMVFASPVLLPALYAVQSSLADGKISSEEIAFLTGSVYQAVIAAFIDLFKKYKGGK